MIFQAFIGTVFIAELVKYGCLWGRFLNKMNGAYEVNLRCHYLCTFIAFLIPATYPVSLLVQFGTDIFFAFENKESHQYTKIIKQVQNICLSASTPLFSIFILYIIYFVSRITAKQQKEEPEEEDCGETTGDQMRSDNTLFTGSNKNFQFNMSLLDSKMQNQTKQLGEMTDNSKSYGINEALKEQDSNNIKSENVQDRSQNLRITQGRMELLQRFATYKNLPVFVSADDHSMQSVDINS